MASIFKVYLAGKVTGNLEKTFALKKWIKQVGMLK
jgi:hypothetical protein